MKVISFVVLIILSLNIFSYQMSDLAMMGYNGKVFQTMEIYYRDGIISMLKFQEFNKQGNMTYEISSFNIEGSNTIKCLIDMRYTYIYDNHGYKKKYERMSRYEKNFNEVTKSSFDISGNETRRIIYNNVYNELKKTSEYIFGYDDKNRIVSYSETTFNSYDGEIHKNNLFTYTYCNNGDIIKSTQYNGNYSKIGNIDIFTYDENNVIIRHKEVKPNGDVISDKEINVNNSFFMYKNTKCKYDKKCNVVKLIENDDVIMEKRIIYYNDIERDCIFDDKYEEKYFK